MTVAVCSKRECVSEDRSEASVKMQNKSRQTGERQCIKPEEEAVLMRGNSLTVSMKLLLHFPTRSYQAKRQFYTQSGLGIKFGLYPQIELSFAVILESSGKGGQLRS